MRIKHEHKILVGAILGAHGIQGHVRVRSFTEDPHAIFAFKNITDESGQRGFTLKSKGRIKGAFIASCAITPSRESRIKDRNEAEALRGAKLYIDRSELPKTRKNEYYEADLIGLEAIDSNKKTQGKVLALHDYGGGPFLEIMPEKGASFMLPFNDTFIPEVDMKAGSISVIIPEGWIESDNVANKQKTIGSPKKRKRPK